MRQNGLIDELLPEQSKGNYRAALTLGEKNNWIRTTSARKNELLSQLSKAGAAHGFEASLVEGRFDASAKTPSRAIRLYSPSDKRELFIPWSPLRGGTATLNPKGNVIANDIVITNRDGRPVATST